MVRSGSDSVGPGMSKNQSPLKPSAVFLIEENLSMLVYTTKNLKLFLILCIIFIIFLCILVLSG